MCAARPTSFEGAAPGEGARGIAHAFNGSLQQAQAFIALGFAGFGGAVTYDRALQLRRLAWICWAAW